MTRPVRPPIPATGTGGPAEREPTARVAGRHGPDLGGATELRRPAGVPARARVVVAGTTGPAPLAAAVGTPVVRLCAPVVPAERWAPHGVPHLLLGDRAAPCAGTRARRCPVPGRPCLDGIDDADVLAAVAALWGSPADSRRRRRGQGEQTDRGAAV
ncbi:hypothetical protein GCM10010294_34290 [Streptomyces griseoloalbus]|uniref:hypothetical protein n=1 Tax=Streptomyces griseoloalbus TaxID=67303 RepID=UPI0019BAD6E9|nr:hypothetical protein GCM10010294_34290 [Streptomyces griseoloalbus]